MNISAATKSYEQWLHGCAPVVESHLRAKHALMKESPFNFLRGTYYRWAVLWREACRECVHAPKVMSAGDLHVDNFATWRDAEGRLCWGIDDFDEAWPLPYTNDLIRLAASVRIAKRLGWMESKARVACDAILTGYEETLKEGGRPIVLAEQETHLEKLGIDALDPPEGFWKELTACPTVRRGVPRDAKAGLEESLPNPKPEYRVVQREAGIGSLGQERFAAIAECAGGWIAREAKRMVPAANVWIEGRTGHRQAYYAQTIQSAARSHDPFQKISGSWLIRRLSPDSNPIKIEELSGERDEETLLHAMGTETANVHVGSKRQVSRIRNDLRRRKSTWLRSAATKMEKITLREWKEYRR